MYIDRTNLYVHTNLYVLVQSDTNLSRTACKIPTSHLANTLKAQELLRAKFDQHSPLLKSQRVICVTNEGMTPNFVGGLSLFSQHLTCYLQLTLEGMAIIVMMIATSRRKETGSHTALLLPPCFLHTTTPLHTNTQLRHYFVVYPLHIL